MLVSARATSACETVADASPKRSEGENDVFTHFQGEGVEILCDHRGSKWGGTHPG